MKREVQRKTGGIVLVFDMFGLFRSVPSTFGFEIALPVTEVRFVSDWPGKWSLICLNHLDNSARQTMRACLRVDSSSGSKAIGESALPTNPQRPRNSIR